MQLNGIAARPLRDQIHRKLVDRPSQSKNAVTLSVAMRVHNPDRSQRSNQVTRSSNATAC